MKVLTLLRYYPALTESFVRAELFGLVEAGHQPTVLSMGTRADSALVPPEDQPPVPVWHLPRRPLARYLPFREKSAGERFLAAHQRPRDAARLPWLRARVAAAGFDRLHVHFAGEAAELAHALWLDLGLPYSVTTHAVDLFRPRPALATVLAAATPAFTVCAHHQRHLGRSATHPR